MFNESNVLLNKSTSTPTTYFSGELNTERLWDIIISGSLDLDSCINHYYISPETVETVKKLLIDKAQTQVFYNLNAFGNIKTFLETYPLPNDILETDLLLSTLSNHFFLSEEQHSSLLRDNDSWKDRLCQSFFISAILDLPVTESLGQWIKKIRMTNDRQHERDLFILDVCIDPQKPSILPLIMQVNPATKPALMTLCKAGGKDEVNTENTETLSKMGAEKSSNVSQFVGDISDVLNNPRIISAIIFSKFILSPAGRAFYLKDENEDEVLISVANLFKHLYILFGTISISGPQYLEVYQDYIRDHELLLRPATLLNTEEQLLQARMIAMARTHDSTALQSFSSPVSNPPFLFLTCVNWGYGDLFFARNAVSATLASHPEQRITWVITASEEKLDIFYSSKYFKELRTSIEIIRIDAPEELYTNLRILKLLLHDKAFTVPCPGGHSMTADDILYPCIKPIVYENGLVNFPEYNYDQEKFDDCLPNYQTGLGAGKLGIFIPQEPPSITPENDSIDSIYHQLLTNDAPSFLCYFNQGLGVDQFSESISIPEFFALLVYKAVRELYELKNPQYKRILVVAPIEEKHLPIIEEFFTGIKIDKLKTLRWCKVKRDAKVDLTETILQGYTKEYAEEGIEMCIVNSFPFLPEQIFSLMKNFSRFCMTTGDQNYGEALVLEKLFFYQTMNWKTDVLPALLSLMRTIKVKGNTEPDLGEFRNNFLKNIHLLKKLQADELNPEGRTNVLELQLQLEIFAKEIPILQPLYIWVWLQFNYGWNPCHDNAKAQFRKDYLNEFFKLMTNYESEIIAGLAIVNRFILENQNLNQRLPETLYKELRIAQANSVLSKTGFLAVTDQPLNGQEPQTRGTSENFAKPTADAQSSTFLPTYKAQSKTSPKLTPKIPEVITNSKLETMRGM